MSLKTVFPTSRVVLDLPSRAEWVEVKSGSGDDLLRFKLADRDLTSAIEDQAALEFQRGNVDDANLLNAAANARKVAGASMRLYEALDEDDRRVIDCAYDACVATLRAFGFKVDNCDKAERFVDAITLYAWSSK